MKFRLLQARLPDDLVRTEEREAFATQMGVDSDSILPFDIQIGSSIKPEYMPLRFSFPVFNIYGGNNLNYNRLIADTVPVDNHSSVSNKYIDQKILNTSNYYKNLILKISDLDNLE